MKNFKDAVPRAEGAIPSTVVGDREIENQTILSVICNIQGITIIGPHIFHECIFIKQSGATFVLDGLIFSLTYTTYCVLRLPTYNIAFDVKALRETCGCHSSQPCLGLKKPASVRSEFVSCCNCKYYFV